MDPQHLLRTASFAPASSAFRCEMYRPEWNAFVEEWAPVVHSFLLAALGPYGREPQRTILAMPEAITLLVLTRAMSLGLDRSGSADL